MREPLFGTGESRIIPCRKCGARVKAGGAAANHGDKHVAAGEASVTIAASGLRYEYWLEGTPTPNAAPATEFAGDGGKGTKDE